MKKKRALRILSLILLCALTFTACKKECRNTGKIMLLLKDEKYRKKKDKDEQEKLEK